MPIFPLIGYTSLHFEQQLNCQVQKIVMRLVLDPTSDHSLFVLSHCLPHTLYHPGNSTNEKWMSSEKFRKNNTAEKSIMKLS